MDGNVDISIIIPCFNCGDYLAEAIESVNLSKSNFSYNIIVINDGSTDPKTVNLLNQISTNNIKILHQQNCGPASARNNGIEHSHAKYILFLDSDNKIRPDFIEISLKLMEEDSNIDIVYGKPSFFGDLNTRKTFETDTFELDKLWIENYIDMCSIIRRSVWESVGKLDEDPLLIGHEDWEFWLRAGMENKKFHFLNEIMFDYRINNNSLTTKSNDIERYNKMLQYVYGKNYIYFQNKLQVYKRVLSLYNDDKRKPFRTFIKNLYHKYYK